MRPTGTPWLAWMAWVCSSVWVCWVLFGHFNTVYSLLNDGRIWTADQHLLVWLTILVSLMAVRITYEFIVLAHAALLRGWLYGSGEK